MTAHFPPVARGAIGVADVGEIGPGKMKRIEIRGRGYLLVNLDGVHYAVDDTCTHEDYPLAFGCIRDGMIKCSLHGSRFCVRTGAAQEEPASEPLGTYRVFEADGRVWIDPARKTG